VDEILTTSEYEASGCRRKGEIKTKGVKKEKEKIHEIATTSKNEVSQ
jgi:hypothetical protein